MSRMYTTSVIQNLIQDAIDQGYEVLTVTEGVLGYGTTVLISPKPEWYNFVIQEHYLNQWSSGHTVRRTQKFGKKLLEQIEAAREMEA